MKKVLASLLAVCMMAGLAVPAFAKYEYSSQAGLDEEITELVFTADSVTVANDGSTIDLNDYLVAYCGNEKICQEPIITWSITSSLAVGIDDSGVVSAFEDSGSAVVTATAEATGKSATIKVVASKAPADPKKATGFKFAGNGSNYFVVDATTAEAVGLTVVPTPSGTVFTAEQIKQIMTWTADVTNAKKEVVGTAVATGNNGSTEVYFSIENLAAEVATYTVTLEEALVHNDVADWTQAAASDFYGSYKRIARASVVKGIPATRIIRTGSVKIEVGQTANLNDYIALTTGANYNNSVSFSMDLFNEDSEAIDYAVQDDTNNYMIKGIAVGKQKAIAVLDINGASVEIPIEVVARGTLVDEDAEYAITPSTASVKVGESVELTLKNGDAAVENVTWTVSDGKLATITTAANPTSFNAKAEGKVVVYARVDDKVVATSVITVVGNGEATTPDGTDNPSTGDSWFANLF